METESKTMVGYQGLRERELWLMVTEFQHEMMNQFWRWMVMMVVPH